MLELDDYDGAISACTEAVKLDSDYGSAYIFRGVAYEKKGEYDQAVADFTEAINRQPDYSSEPYVWRAAIYVSRGEDGKAIADFTEAIRVKPKDSTNYKSHATVFKQAIRLDNYASYYLGRGLVHHRNREYDQATNDYTEAISLFLDSEFNKAIAYQNRGRSYAIKGDDDQAVKDYTDAIRLFQQFNEKVDDLVLAYNDRADAYARMGMSDLAAADRRKSEELKGKEKD